MGMFNRYFPVKAQASVLGAVSASFLLWGLLNHARTGLPLPAELNAMPFQVAMISGEKQAELEVEENLEVVTTETLQIDEAALMIQSQEVASQLPQAVQEASSPNLIQQGEARKDDVIPPAQVSMPGGIMESENAAISKDAGPDPLKIGTNQVYIRLFVNFEGKAVRGGIVRAGRDPFQDAILLRIVKSRIYKVSAALPSMEKDTDGSPTWQVDLVLDYGNDLILP